MIYYASEGEGEMTIDIVRLGPAEEESSVYYRTEENQHDGIKFRGTSGTAVFPPGETMVSVPVMILDNDKFASLSI